MRKEISAPIIPRRERAINNHNILKSITYPSIGKRDFVVV